MLRLSPSAQTNTATGIIINYITVDVVHSRRFWAQLNDFIYCPSVVSVKQNFYTLNFAIVVENTQFLDDHFNGRSCLPSRPS